MEGYEEQAADDDGSTNRGPEGKTAAVAATGAAASIFFTVAETPFFARSRENPVKIGMFPLQT